MLRMVLSENTMLLAVSLLVLVSSAVAERIRCGTDGEIGTRFDKTEGDIEGRYTVDWCSEVPHDATVWYLTLEYPANNNSKLCNSTKSQRLYTISTKLHSILTFNITDRPQCKITCFSVPLDLVFSSCYKIVNQLKSPIYAFTPNSTLHQITNKFYSLDAFTKLRPSYIIEKDIDLLLVTFNLRYIPVGDFKMRRKEYKQNYTIKEIDSIEWEDVHDHCKEDTFTVACTVKYPPKGRCVALGLEYEAPWRHFIDDPNVMYYCSVPTKEVELDPGMDARVWWAVGALALVLTVLASMWVAKTRWLADARKKVLRDWIHRYEEYTAEHTPAPASDPGYILLLYARDCAPAMEAVGVLKEMLEAGAPGRVYDIFSPECMAVYAQAPEEWLCGVLARPDVRVVLVQTPAAAALYEAQVNQYSLQMQQPLLGARVQYKKPHYGDVLLQFALRLVRGMAPLQQEYARYYIATVSELDDELMPQVAAYRRYVLPPHAARLLLDLRLPADQPQRLRRLATAVEDLVDYVRANENYLKDELMFL